MGQQAQTSTAPLSCSALRTELVQCSAPWTDSPLHCLLQGQRKAAAGRHFGSHPFWAPRVPIPFSPNYWNRLSISNQSTETSSLFLTNPKASKSFAGVDQSGSFIDEVCCWSLPLNWQVIRDMHRIISHVRKYIFSFFTLHKIFITVPWIPFCRLIKC